MNDLAEAFRDQAKACNNLGSPFMFRLLNILADHWPDNTETARHAATFTGDLGPRSVSLPLRIAGGLHAIRLKGDHGLARVYPPHITTDEMLSDAVRTALHDHDAFLAKWIESPPQTNELRRSAALIPGARWVAEQFGLPVWLSELGASGGLNLMWDQFALTNGDWRVGATDPAVTLSPDWTGPAPGPFTPDIAHRRGVDLNPLDPTNDDDLLRMTAYLWPDQPHRLENTRAAAGSVYAPVDQGDAIAWLAERLVSAPDQHLHLVQNTIAWQYFPPDLQAEGIALLEEAGAKASPERPLAWLQLETDGDLHGLGGAALTVQVWPTGKVIPLGRADFHGRWVRWEPPLT